MPDGAWQCVDCGKSWARSHHVEPTHRKCPTTEASCLRRQNAALREALGQIVMHSGRTDEPETRLKDVWEIASGALRLDVQEVPSDA